MPKHILKSIGAVLAGFMVVFILSVGTDAVVEGVGLLPPANQPQAYLWWHLLIALVYRCVFTVLGGYVTAKLAPSLPMRHVMTLAVIGTAFATLGTIANWSLAVQSGAWYPIALLVLSPVCLWVGGKLQTKA